MDKAFVTPENLSFPSLHIASMSYFIRCTQPNLCGTRCMSDPNDKDLDLVDLVSLLAFPSEEWGSVENCFDAHFPHWILRARRCDLVLQQSRRSETPLPSLSNAVLVSPSRTTRRAACPARLSQQLLLHAVLHPWAPTTGSSRGNRSATAEEGHKSSPHPPLSPRPPSLLLLPSVLSGAAARRARSRPCGSLPCLSGESRPERKRRGGGGSRGFAGGRGGARALLHGEAGEEQAPEEGTRELTQRSSPACFPGSTASLLEPAEGRYRHRDRCCWPRGLGPCLSRAARGRGRAAAAGDGIAVLEQQEEPSRVGWKGGEPGRGKAMAEPTPAGPDLSVGPSLPPAPLRPGEAGRGAAAGAPLPAEKEGGSAGFLLPSWEWETSPMGTFQEMGVRVGWQD